MPYGLTEDQFADLAQRACEDWRIQQAIRRQIVQRDTLLNDYLSGTHTSSLAPVARELNAINQLETQLENAGALNISFGLQPFVAALAKILIVWMVIVSLSAVILLSRMKTDLFGPNSPLLLLPIISPLTISVASMVLIASSRETWHIWQDFRATQAARKGLIVARREYQAALVQAIIIPDLIELINRNRPDPYTLAIENLSAPDLAEIFQSEHQIPTAAFQRLDTLLAEMPGGSIGVAGPRGSGKSTILRAACKRTSLPRENAVPQLDNKQSPAREMIGVFITAPIRYEARDFILYLFSSLCRRVIEKTTGTRLSARQHLAQSRSNRGRMRVYLIAAFTMISGLGLLALSVQIGMHPAKHPNSLEQFLTVVRIGPPGLFRLSVVLLAISIPFMFLSLGTYSPLRLISLFNRSRSVGKSIEFPDGTIGLQTAVPSGNTGRIFQEASVWLREIRVEQNYGTVQEVTAKLPSFIEAKMSRSNSWSSFPLTLPEIIDAYLEFLQKVTDQFDVVIGIDELDKLESVAASEAFLNGIKAIFGVSRCFYLVSVSEDAMSNFERRGLPFRDAFDSSFDVIVAVSHLDMRGSLELIDRRVIGTPIPQVAVCYALSGGLPRDLIRKTRDLFDIARELAGPRNIQQACHAMVNAEILEKASATGIAARDIAVEPESSRLVSCTADLRRQIESDTYLFDICRRLYGVPGFGLAARPAGEGSDAERERVERLGVELAAFIYLAVTIRTVFHEGATSDDLKMAVAGGHIETLASARRALAVAPGLALSEVNRVRSLMRMPTIDVSAVERGSIHAAGAKASG